MKTIVAVIALTCLSGFAVFAQDANATPAQMAQSQPTAKGHRMDPERQLQTLTKRLNLTADQQNQLRPILADRAAQFESIRNDSTLASADRRTKLHALREDSTAKIESVLNDQQKQTYQQMREKMRQHANDRREPGA